MSKRLSQDDMPNAIYAYHKDHGTGTWIDFDDSTKEDPATRYYKFADEPTDALLDAMRTAYRPFDDMAAVYDTVRGYYLEREK